MIRRTLLSRPAVKATGATAFASVALLAGCGLVSDTPSQRADAGEEVRSALVDSGVSSDVVDCVLRLGSSEIERNNYNAALEEELRAACQAAQVAFDEGDGESPSLASEEVDGIAFVDGPVGYGDDGDLDALWDECEAGSGSACDELFDRSPLHSDYEEFGLSCGQRPDVVRCQDLDDPEVTSDASVPDGDQDVDRR